MITIEPITTLPELRGIRDEWGRVLDASGSDSINLSHPWLEVWASTMGGGRKLLILRLKRGDATIGFVPLMFNQVRMKRFLPYNQLVFLSDPWADFGDVIVTGDRDEAVRAIFEYLGRRSDWGEILLHNIPETSPNFAAFRRLAEANGDVCELAPRSTCFVIPMASTTWRNTIRRRARTSSARISSGCRTTMRRSTGASGSSAGRRSERSLRR